MARLNYVFAVTSESGRRDERGRFISPEYSVRLMLQANKAAATQVQADVVAFTQERIKRRAVSTGRLTKVTASAQNAYATEFGWGVGDEDYLDRSVAKYWRQIEQGYSGHVGRSIRGFWGGSIAGFYENAWGRVPRGGAPYTPHGEGRQGKFIPRRRGNFFDPETGVTFKSRRPGAERVAEAVIGQPIEAIHAYSDAFAGSGSFIQGCVEAAGNFLLAEAYRAIEGL